MAPCAAQAKKTFLPGVAAINGDIGAAGAVIDGYSSVIVSGKSAVPVTGPFGAQIGGAASVGSIDSSAIAAHLFARDPARGLIGVTGMLAKVDNWNFKTTNMGFQDIYRLGLEGEI